MKTTIGKGWKVRIFKSGALCYEINSDNPERITEILNEIDEALTKKNHAKINQ